MGVPRPPGQRSRCRACATSRACRRAAFDGRGNFSLGVREQIIFPEINYDKIDKIKGLNISIVTTARDRRRGSRAARAPRDAVPAAEASTWRVCASAS